jgi:hypothetical protein
MTRKLTPAHNGASFPTQKHVDRDVRVDATLGGLVSLVTRGRSQFIARRPEPKAPLVIRSRQVRVARVARTDRAYFGPGTAHRPRVQASLGVDRRGNPPRSAITNQLAAPKRRPIVFYPHHRPHAFPSLCGACAQGRGREPARSTRSGRGHRAGGVTPKEQRAGPAVKTSNPRLSPRDAHASSVAFGLGVRIPAAGPAHLRLYSHSGGLRARSSKLLELLRAPPATTRRRNRTFQAGGCPALPVLKTGWATRPVPRRG